MLKNYLRVATRNLRRHLGYTVLNVVGLAVGIACCLFLLLYVQDELSYDRFHEGAEHVFRVSAVFDEREIALTPPMVAELLATELPAVKASTRINPGGGLIRVGEDVFEQQSVFFADASVFEVLTHPFRIGDAATALDRPDTIVLTETTAKRYFGDSNPIGQTITYRDRDELEVTGVIEDVPTNAHYSFDAVAALDPPDNPPVWSNANTFSFEPYFEAQLIQSDRAVWSIHYQFGS